ncbi:MAG: class I SAM-dependent methyltransferase [Sandaracinaceae bacterium]|nr:class I SAM-dependent methyltransferase [Sandaracinaceae bacterium]
MANRTLPMNDALHAYLVGVSVDEPEPMRRLRAETAKLPNAVMQIGPEQGAFMTWLVGLIGARRAIEVGVFTGYSAMCVARALPANGRLVACDVSAELTAIGKRYWAEAGLSERIDLRIGPGIETLDALLGAGEAGHYDFAFIDADKPNYDRYYEQCLLLMRPGGVIAIDNVLWGGDVVDESKRDASTEALRAIAKKVAADPRVDACMVPIGDGLTLARKR